MANENGTRVVLVERPQGAVALEHFRVESFPIPVEGPGELLVEANYLSLDPYMRGRMDVRKSYAKPLNIGDVMPGQTVSTVIRSQHSDFAAGDLVLAHAGWRTHAVVEGAKARRVASSSIPVTAQLGVLGMPGFTAYAGLKEIGKPKKGETVAVAAAAGPVGSLVGQLAKIAGARAVGIAGGPEKCAYLLNELGFDRAVDHKSAHFPEDLAAACPEGIDVYYENVGGAVWQAVLPLLNRFARVPVSGLIAHYDAPSDNSGPDLLPATMRSVISQRLLIQGFLNFDYKDKLFSEFQHVVGNNIAGGAIKFREDIVDGLAAAPKAFLGMLAGNNFGKLLVRIKEPTMKVGSR